MTDRPSLTAALCAVLAAFAGLLVYNVLLRFLTAYNLLYSATAVYLFSISFQGLVFAVPALLYYRREPGLWPAMRLRLPDPLCALLVLMAALVGVLALNWLSVYWSLLLRAIGLHTSTGNELAPRTGEQLGMMLLAVAIVPAVCEEVLFRGLLLPSLEIKGRRVAVLVSGVLFALMHARVEALPSHLLLGFVLGTLVLRTGSLPAAMLYHAAHNAIILFMAFWASQYDPASLDAFPTLGESLRSLPMVLALLGVWLLLLHTAMTRGAKRQPSPLPDAERRPFTRTAIGMLVGSGAALMLAEVVALIGMIPGGTA